MSLLYKLQRTSKLTPGKFILRSHRPFLQLWLD